MARIEKQLTRLTQREDKIHLAMAEAAADHAKVLELNGQLREIVDEREMLELEWLAAAEIVSVPAPPSTPASFPVPGRIRSSPSLISRRPPPWLMAMPQLGRTRRTQRKARQRGRNQAVSPVRIRTSRAPSPSVSTDSTG